VHTEVFVQLTVYYVPCLYRLIVGNAAPISDED